MGVSLEKSKPHIVFLENVDTIETGATDESERLDRYPPFFNCKHVFLEPLDDTGRQLASEFFQCCHRIVLNQAK